MRCGIGKTILSVLMSTNMMAQTPAFSLQARDLNGHGFRAVTGDFNRDGKLDIAALVDVEGNITLEVFLGNGDGTFRIVQIHQLGVPATDLATADLNGDGVPDLVIESADQNHGSAQLILYVGLGDGSFRIAENAILFDHQEAAVRSTGAAPLNIGDVNGDGKPDIVFGPHYGPSVHARITVLPGNGDGTFRPAVESVTDIQQFFIAGLARATLGDVTNDGMADLILTYQERGGQYFLEVYNGQSDGKMVRSYTLPPGPICSGFAAPVTGDFNRDGKLDFAVDLCSGYQIILQGIGHFVPAGLAQAVFPSFGVQTDGVQTDLLAGDLDGDGKLDLVSVQGDNLVLLRGNGDGTFAQPGATDPRPTFYAGTSPVPLRIADLNGDGKPDLLVLTDTSIVALLQGSPSRPEVGAANVVNAASGVPGPVAPGSIVSIYGADFAVGTGSVGAQLSAFGSQVTLNSTQMALLYVSPAQINAVVPMELASPSQAALTVTRNGSVSTPVAIQLATYAPGIFTLNGATPPQAAAVVVAPNYFVAAPAGKYPGSRPAHHGDTVALFGTGMGPAAVPNSIPCLDGLSCTLATPIVSIGGIPTTVVFSGLAPGLIGVNQVNVIVPQGVLAGDAVPIVLSIGGVTANNTTIAVQ